MTESPKDHGPEHTAYCWSVASTAMLRSMPSSQCPYCRAWWDGYNAAMLNTSHGFAVEAQTSRNTDRVFTRPDGSQVLVTVWPDGSSRLAERPDRWSAWGPATDGAVAP